MELLPAPFGPGLPMTALGLVSARGTVVGLIPKSDALAQLELGLLLATWRDRSRSDGEMQVQAPGRKSGLAPDVILS